MSKEGPPLQHDLFTGELVDNRSNYQKRKDKDRSAPQQLQMFRTPEIVQFGVSARPWLKDAPQPQLVLEIQETRTPEQIERDLMREAEKQTVSLFGDAASSLPGETETTDRPFSRIIYNAQTHRQPVGLRAWLRAQQIPVRPRNPRRSTTP